MKRLQTLTITRWQPTGRQTRSYPQQMITVSPGVLRIIRG